MPSLRTIALIGALAALIYVVWSLVDLGGDRERNRVERQNNEAANEADTHRLDYDACVDGGFVWDFAAGECERAP